MGEKTEPASPKKREDERKKGNVFVSKDVSTLVTLIVSFYVFSMFLGNALEYAKRYLEKQIIRTGQLTTVTGSEILSMLTEMASYFAMSILPVMLIIALVSVLIVAVQTKGLFSRELFKFKADRMDPIKGMKKFVSLRSLVELVKSMIKISILTYLLYNNVLESMQYLPTMIDWDINQAIGFTGDAIMSLVLSVAVAFSAVAGLDYLYQRWEYEKGIRMSKQDLKDEYKQMEGNPEIKSKRRQLQQEYAQQRMMAAVKDADVIVRNPTHYAVALKYKLDVDPAPIVLAKGADLIALKIVEEGEKHGIATVENKPLARGLYETADVFGYIPAEFFQPVAELLAWIYASADGKAASL